MMLAMLAVTHPVKAQISQFCLLCQATWTNFVTCHKSGVTFCDNGDFTGRQTASRRGSEPSGRLAGTITDSTQKSHQTHDNCYENKGYGP